VKRYHDEISLMDRRAKEWMTFGPGGVERGRFRKKKPFDCGKSRCSVCHVESKFPKRTPTRKERMNDADQDY
jgi:hypothetical protein